ncbi:MAG: c-type cytochrome domain-containing protein [Candidatus Marinimicrobia bacterium]|nr:c-type cytochrome domain-containing protein [Candidatus Neomarinimicrobiota bacterium]
MSVAQTFSFDYGETSADVDLGTYVQFEGSITNTTDSLITIAVVKNVNEIPDGWASMICIGNLCYPPYVDSVTADIVGIDYSVSIQPIFNQSCTGCHDGSNPAGGLNLLSYEDLMSNNVIVPGDHEASELYDRITRPESSNGNMPPAGSLGQDEIDLIADWIDEGALNGEKTADFSLDVVVQETEGIGNIQIALLDVAYPEEAVTVDYTVSTTQSEMTLTVDHLIDWNMVGLPLVVEDGNVSTIFPDAINGTLYSFGVSYILEETLENGKGYWLRFDDSGSSDITGGEITSLTMSMNEGWNLISGISSTIFLENILDPWEIIIDGTLYGYNGSYLYTESLVPGEGYWLRTNDEGDITLSSSQQSARAVSSADRLDRSNRLEFANGNYTNTLYFGENIPDETRLSYSLPPVFPYMAFDARFTDNMRNTEDGGKIQVINTNSSLNIHYNIMINAGEQKEWILATGVGEEYVLTGAGEITLPGGSQEMTLGKRTILPDNYTLHQNYPNPFNPVTTLRYSLPFYDHVTLTIYDLSGREINQIVNTSQPAGFQSVVWNATDYFGRSVGAGVYLYQIQAGDFKDTKKMVLLK